MTDPERHEIFRFVPGGDHVAISARLVEEHLPADARRKIGRKFKRRHRHRRLHGARRRDKARLIAGRIR
ncbi:MAG: hypothetical protein ACWGMY_09835 [Hyphomicrobiaceae bacterium]